MKKVTKRITSAAIALAMACSMVVIPASAQAPFTTENTVIRGTDRYDTAFRVAQSVKKVYNVSKLNNIIIANGLNFPDALSGTYLAAKTKAPIIFTDNTTANLKKIKEFMKSNCTSNCKVYLLGGDAVVKATVEKGLQSEKYTVKRLSGQTRYDTNLDVLKSTAASTESEFFICCGDNFPDALAVSAVKKPIMIVGKNGLTTNQVNYLKGLKNKKFTIVGGTGAVPEKIAAQLKKYGSVNRLYGVNRYETSNKVNEKYLSKASTAVYVNGTSFADALSGATLAISANGAIVLAQAPASEAALPSAKFNPTKHYYLGDAAQITREFTNGSMASELHCIAEFKKDAQFFIQWNGGTAYNSKVVKSNGKTYYQATLKLDNSNFERKIVFFKKGSKTASGYKPDTVVNTTYATYNDVKGSVQLKTTYAWDYCVVYENINSIYDITSDINGNSSNKSQYYSSVVDIRTDGVQVYGPAAVGEKCQAKAFINGSARAIDNTYNKLLTSNVKINVKHYNPVTKAYVTVASPFDKENDVVLFSDGTEHKPCIFDFKFTSSNSKVVKFTNSNNCTYTITGKGSATIKCGVYANGSKIAEIFIPVTLI